MNGFLSRASRIASSFLKKGVATTPKKKAVAARRYPPAQERLQYAVLVDAENSQAHHLEAVMEEVVALGGESPVRRIYGDFMKSLLAPWRETALSLSFTPVNAFSYVSGKNTSDSFLIIDAMDILHTNSKIDGFVLVSSDSDFTLAQRLRESGKHIVGFGRTQTPAPFVNACERFVHVENLKSSSDTKKKLPHNTIKLIIKKVIDDNSDEDGWASCGIDGSALLRLKNDFDVRTFGHKKLTMLLQANEQHFELSAEKGSNVSVRCVSC